MELIYSEIGRAFGQLLIAFIAFVIFDTAIKASGTNKKVLLNGLLICAGISLLISLALGSPSCIEYEEDVRGGICIEYADNSYGPTAEQYIANFAYLLTLLYVPVVLAVMKRKDFF